MGKKPLPAESWHALGVCGLLFPLHIILGICSVPFWIYHLVQLSPTAWLLLVVYMPFYLYPFQSTFPAWAGSRVSTLFWRHLACLDTTGKSYFGAMEVHNAEVINPKDQYFVAVHPHGTICINRIFWRSESLQRCFDRPWRMVAASVLFRIPIIREMTLIFGATDAAKRNIKNSLQAGVNVVVYPGGLDEANTSDVAGQGSVTVRTRTGFIRLAIEHSVNVLPVFVFGETDVVQPINLLPAWIQAWIQETFRMSTTGFIGRWNTFLPSRVPLNMVVGKPILVQHFNRKDDEAGFEAEVARVGGQYKDTVAKIYEENKARFGYEDRPLVFTGDKGYAKPAKPKLS